MSSICEHFDKPLGLQQTAAALGLGGLFEHGNSGVDGLLGRQFFFDPRGLAAAITQVVQLGAAHVTTTLDLNAGDQGL